MSENNTNNERINEVMSEMKIIITDLKSLAEDVKELKNSFQNMKTDLDNIRTQYGKEPSAQKDFNEDQDVDSWVKARQRHARMHQDKHDFHGPQWRNKNRREYTVEPLEYLTRDIGDFTNRFINTIIPNVLDNINDAFDDISECIEDSFEGIPAQINLRIGRPSYKRVYSGRERVYVNQEDPALKDLMKYPETTQILQSLAGSPKSKLDLQQVLSSTNIDILEKILKTMEELGLLIQEKSGNKRYLITKFGMRILHLSLENKSTDNPSDDDIEHPQS